MPVRVTWHAAVEESSLADYSKSGSASDPQPSMASGRAAQLGIFAALVAFLPIPLIIPFWAIAIVPVSYLVLPGGRVGKVGAAYGLVAALGLYVAAIVLNRMAKSIRHRHARNALVITFMLTLAALSLLPIYKPGLDPRRPNVNIVKLFQHGIPVSQ